MNEQTFKQKDAQRHRIKYWFQKCVNVGLIPHILDEESELRAMFKKWQESRGRPVIRHDDTGESMSPEKTGTNIDEFYQVKKVFELDKDSKWARELKKSAGSESAILPPHNREKAERIQEGESPLIFGHMTAKTNEFPMGV